MLNSFCYSILLQLECLSFWEFWEHAYSSCPHSIPCKLSSFDIVRTSRSRGQHLCSKFVKIPHLGCPRTFKVPTLVPPLAHNIDSCIRWKNVSLVVVLSGRSRVTRAAHSLSRLLGELHVKAGYVSTLRFWPGSPVSRGTLPPCKQALTSIQDLHLLLARTYKQL